MVPATQTGGVLEHAGHAAPEHHAHHGPSPMRRLWGLLAPEWPDLWTVGVFAAGVGLLSLAMPIAVEALVSSVQGGNRAMLQAVVVLSLVLLACLALAGCMRAWQTYIVEYVQRRLFFRIVGDLAHRLPRVRATAFDLQNGPELVNRFFDVLTVQKAGATLMLDGLAVVLQACIGMAVLAMWHPWLLGFNAALLLALVFLVWVLGNGAVSAKIEESYAKYAVAGWLEEMVRYPLAFKQGAGLHYALRRADALSHDYLVTRQGSFRILFRQIVFGIALQAVASAALLGLGGWLVVRNELNLGQLVAAELIVAVTVGSFVKLGKSLESFYDLMAAVDKLGHLLDLPLERVGGEEAPATARPASLEVDRVSYAYEDGTTALSGASLSLAPGERVALAGGAGTGKRTFVELLCGLREPTSGSIRLDGTDLRDLDLESLRTQVVSVGDAEVFQGTVLENVGLGRDGVSQAEVRAALEATGLSSAVQRLPQGLRSPLATGGAPLSRGQAARLVIARAIAGKPRLLVIDRVLDGLDADARRIVMASLFAPGAPWTLLVVSQIPEVMAACCRTVMLDQSPLEAHP